MDESGTRQPPSNATSPPKADTRVTGKILDLIKSVLYNGFPVAATFVNTLSVRVAFVKTDTTLRAAVAVVSSEATAANPAGMTINLTGGAAQANRTVALQTTEIGVANAGTLALQAFGGRVQIGGVTAVPNAQVTTFDTNGHQTVAQANPPTGALGTGAGTGAGTAPVLTITGTDEAGVIQIVTGTQVPAAGVAIVTVSFKTTRAAVPNSVIVQYANGVAYTLARNQDPVAVNYSVNGWVLFANAAALAISSTYQWTYQIR